jgi:hypothetical protein
MKKLFPIVLVTILYGCTKTNTTDNKKPIPVSIWTVNGVTYSTNLLGGYYVSNPSAQFAGSLSQTDYYANTITIGLSPIPTQNSTYYIFGGVVGTLNACSMSFSTQNNEYIVPESTDKINITFSQADSINILTVSFTNIILQGLVIHNTTTATGIVNFLFSKE